VLGNYDRDPIRRLNLVIDRLNRRQDAYAFRMVDIRGEWDNSIQKFCLIGDIVTYLVGVAEKEPSDFLVEQTRAARRHDRVLREEPRPQTGVRGRGAPLRLDAGRCFELFDREGRLYRWQTEEDLVDVTEDLRDRGQDSGCVR